MPGPNLIFTANAPRTKTTDTLDVAARHLAYKLLEATNGEPGAWSALGQIGERPETLARAIERGWVLARGDGKGKVQSASLTPEGRLLARKGRSLSNLKDCDRALQLSARFQTFGDTEQFVRE